MEIYTQKTKWKLLLFLIAVVIGIASLFVTSKLVKDLSIEERKKIELWAEGIRQLSDLERDDLDYSFILRVMEDNTTVPVIQTDENNTVLYTLNIPEKKIDSPEKQAKMLAKMKKSKEPIEVTFLDGKKNYVYYQDSTTLLRLTYYPYIQLSVIMLFIGISYFAFSQSRKAEQDRVWAGMAKETAHQLGTPTSSLLACVDILKESDARPDITTEIEKDVLRLEKIATRFSKIGSEPKLTPQNLISVLNSSIDYLQTRISSKIAITVGYDKSDSIIAKLNGTLFEWVIENVVKNAADAIQGNGEIHFKITDNVQVVYIDITDTGRGIPKSKQKTIFQPGYTTKQRGWGLGLTLSKRIIEDYHGGKIFVNFSEVNKGSSFRIVLPKK
ncbi:MAG TPA: HAMP domain-containing sensor histidine kinase [Tenuifilaceae bacterium]|nr:HAMP domain-containing sensor histidine kinase [Tenuifilaceae bacterium]HQB76819.1 HAMP domain-containing sensor histidine kinase [Tenuifilaceae bacterium]